MQDVAKLFASLPLEQNHLREVHSAVQMSLADGYDEEYTLKDLLQSPGSGVGGTKAMKIEEDNTLRSLVRSYFEKQVELMQTDPTKAGYSSKDVQAYLDELCSSDYQIYWPFRENWNGQDLPLITFDPGFGADVNWAYEVSADGDFLSVRDSVVVTEELAQKRPVWVINHNNDAAYTPLDFYLKSKGAVQERSQAQTKGYGRTLLLKSFTMLRNYDSWFSGGSEFWIKCGGVSDFVASTEAELKLYYPSVTDFYVVVPRGKKDKQIDYDAILLSGFTNQIESLAFLVTEDDGGLRTSWKCSAAVKIKSKSYGFEIEMPFNEKDDIVWRGQLSASFFQAEDIVKGRFGDVIITFALE